MVAVRLTAAGALDPTFGPDGRVRVTPFPDMPADYWSGRLALGPAGEIYLHNGVYDGGGAVGWVTAKLNPNGSLAGGFGDGGFVGFLTGDVASPGDVAVQDGKLVEFGDYNDEGGTIPDEQLWVSRYLPNGAADVMFGEEGGRQIGFDQGDTWEDYAHAMTLQRDGRILLTAQVNVTGDPWNDDWGIVRLTADGDLDSSFGGDGRVLLGFDLATGLEDIPHAIAVDSRGRILVGGVAGGEAVVVRLLPNGALDNSFSGNGRAVFHFASPNAGAYDNVFGLAVQGNGAVIAVGRGTTAAGQSRRFGVARLTADGELDPTFAGDGTRIFDFSQNSGMFSVARAVTLLADGSILAAGGAETAQDDMAFVAAKLYNDYVFADGFDLGDASSWSASAP